MPERIVNLAEGLAREIARVASMRARIAMEDDSPGNLKPLLAIIDASLENAFRAAGSNDAITCLGAYHDLQGYE